MSNERIHLSWIPRQKRIRCTFTKADCGSFDEPPADLLERAKGKLEAEQKAGSISYYRLFESRLNKVWHKLKESDLPSETKINLTLGSGSPELTGLSVQKCDPALGVALVTFDASTEEISEWQPHFVKLTIGKLLRDLEINQIANPAHIKKLWIRACTGEKIKSFPIEPLPNFPEDNESPYLLIEDSNRRDATVAIFDINAFKNHDCLTKLKSDLSELKALKRSADKRDYHFLYDELIRTIRMAEQGPELFGIDLPIVDLAAVDSKIVGNDHKLAEHIGLKIPKPKKKVFVWPKGSTITIKVDHDRLKAEISGSNPQMYIEHSEFALLEMVRGEIKKQGIVHGVTDELMTAVEDRIMCREPIAGCQIAAGDQMVPGKDPYLHPTFLDTIKKPARESGGDIDIRDRQGQNMVKKDSIVAEIIFDVPPVEGKDVFGGPIKATLEDLPKIKVGYGIRVSKDGTKFRAEFSGLPKVDETSIELDKAMVHDGNVNLASGNIKFQGPVEIMGAVEQGALVEVDGDLIIYKGIRGGKVFCSGSVTVMGGIVTGPDGLVKCSGNLETEFIENTEVHCGGTVTIKTAALNAHIFAGESIIVKDPTGKIVGGQMACYDTLICPSIGTSQGTPTRLTIGSNWKAEIAVRLRHKRMAKLEALDDELQKQLTLLSSKTKAQTTKQQGFQKQQVREKLKKLKGILKNKARYIGRAKERRNYNKEAHIIAKLLLSSSVIIKLAGHRVKNDRDVNGIAVYYRGSKIKITPIERFKSATSRAS